MICQIQPMIRKIQIEFRQIKLELRNFKTGFSGIQFAIHKMQLHFGRLKKESVGSQMRSGGFYIERTRGRTMTVIRCRRPCISDITSAPAAGAHYFPYSQCLDSIEL